MDSTNLNKHFEFDLVLKSFDDSRVGDKGIIYIEGVASDLEPDLTNEILSEKALTGLKDQIKQNPVTFLPHHKAEWYESFGRVVDADVKNKQLWVKIAVEVAKEKGQELYNQLKNGIKVGLSIGGALKRAYEVMKNGKKLRVLDDIHLLHLVPTATPCNPRSWLQAISKSWDWNDNKETDMFSLENVLKDNQVQRTGYHLFDALMTVTKSIADVDASDEEKALALKSALDEFSDKFVETYTEAVIQKSLPEGYISELTKAQLATLMKSFEEVIKSEEVEGAVIDTDEFVDILTDVVEKSVGSQLDSKLQEVNKTLAQFAEVQKSLQQLTEMLTKDAPNGVDSNMTLAKSNGSETLPTTESVETTNKVVETPVVKEAPAVVGKLSSKEKEQQVLNRLKGLK